MSEERVPLVSIWCLVYNHEPYLRQCLDGFVMQRTNFPFVAIVHEDASTDGSAAILREYAEKYPDIIKPIYETENQYYVPGSMRRIMDNAIHPGSKYIAYCEGDDYWTDPNKLQKQVDIMESDPDVGLVHTKALKFDQQAQRIVDIQFGNAVDSYEAELKNNEFITLTCCMRTVLLKGYRKFYAENQLSQRGWKMGDYPLWLYACHYSKSAFIPEVTGVYRVLQNSASHGKTMEQNVNFELSALDIQEYFAELYGFQHLKNEIAAKKVSQLQWFSVSYNQAPTYSLAGLKRKYGVKFSTTIRLKHFLLKHRLLREGLIKLIEMKNRG